MKWTNQIENRILIIGTAVVMAVCFWFYQAKFVRPVYRAQNEMMQQLVNSQNRLIEALAKDPKYAIQNDFGKMKPKEGSVINLDLDNTLAVDDNDVTTTTNAGDTVKVQTVKKTWWKRLFK